MQTVTGFIWRENADIWALAEKLRPALAARYDEVCRRDAQWVSDNNEDVSLAEAADRLATVSLGTYREPRVWIAPYDDKLYVLDMTGAYAEAIAAIDGMVDVSFGAEDPEASSEQQERYWMNVAVAQEAFPTGDVTAHGVQITAPADAGLIKIIRAGR